MYNKILSVDYGFGNKRVDGVQIKLSKSTSQAEAFHLAMKVACLDWTDPIIDWVNKLVDKRLLDIAEANEKGIYFKITYKDLGSERERSKTFITTNKEKAIDLFSIQNKDATIIKVEEILSNNNYVSDEKSSIISNPL